MSMVPHLPPPDTGEESSHGITHKPLEHPEQD
jgi:hypothetical protein